VWARWVNGAAWREKRRREEGRRGGADNTTFSRNFSAVLISPDYWAGWEQVTDQGTPQG
jgi:hypothetical protein